MKVIRVAVIISRAEMGCNEFPLSDWRTKVLVAIIHILFVVSYQERDAVHGLQDLCHED